MMKQGVRPTWEDNPEGGSWSLRVKKEDTHFVWKELVLAAIGEQFCLCLNDDDDISGVSVSIRAFDNIIQLWNKKASSKNPKVMARIQELISDIELRNSFYKPNREHLAFDSTREGGSKSM